MTIELDARNAVISNAVAPTLYLSEQESLTDIANDSLQLVLAHCLHVQF